MRIYFASDHAGFPLKQELVAYVKELGHDAVDMGAAELNPQDDYPDFVFPLAQKVASEEEALGVVIGGSGQGEAIAANRVRGARAAVYYGPAPKSQTDAGGKELDLLASTREHNNANVLSLGARFLSTDEAKKALAAWLSRGFSGEERHVRRIQKLDAPQ